jgi:hypothetical protein
MGPSKSKIHNFNDFQSIQIIMCRLEPSSLIHAWNSNASPNQSNLNYDFL